MSESFGVVGGLLLLVIGVLVGVVLVLFLGVFLVFPLVCFVVGVPVQARWRGYSFLVWGSVCLLTLNPLFALVALALVPDRKRKLLRQLKTQELLERLAAVPMTVLPLSPTVSRDRREPLSKAFPPTPRARPGMDPSSERSVGDEETRP